MNKLIWIFYINNKIAENKNKRRSAKEKSSQQGDDDDNSSWKEKRRNANHSTKEHFHSVHQTTREVELNRIWEPPIRDQQLNTCAKHPLPSQSSSHTHAELCERWAWRKKREDFSWACDVCICGWEFCAQTLLKNYMRCINTSWNTTIQEFMNHSFCMLRVFAFLYI